MRQLQEDRKNDKKPPPYKHIKVIIPKDLQYLIIYSYVILILSLEYKIKLLMDLDATLFLKKKSSLYYSTLFIITKLQCCVDLSPILKTDLMLASQIVMLI